MTALKSCVCNFYRTLCFHLYASTVIFLFINILPQVGATHFSVLHVPITVYKHENLFKHTELNQLKDFCKNPVPATVRLSFIIKFNCSKGITENEESFKVLIIWYYGKITYFSLTKTLPKALRHRNLIPALCPMSTKCFLLILSLILQSRYYCLIYHAE